jgi:hypothetical protein
MNTTRPNPQNLPDRMTSVAEMQQQTAEQQKANAIINAMAQNAINAACGIAQQGQIPPPQIPRACVAAFSRAIGSLAQQTGIPREEVRSIVDAAIGADLEMRNRLGRRAIAIVRRLSNALANPAQVPGSFTEVEPLESFVQRELSSEIDAMVTQLDVLEDIKKEHGDEVNPEEGRSSSPTCGARFPRKGAICSLAPHEGDEHCDASISLRWTSKDV